MIREICARELHLPKEHPFFSMTFKEDYEPLGWSHDDFLLHATLTEMDAHETETSLEEAVLILCHG